MTIARVRLLSCLVLSCLLLLGLVALVPATTEAQPGCGGKPGRYKLKIDSAPPGATIFLTEGCPLGVTPWAGGLDAGSYTLTLKLPGYEVAVRSFKVGKTRRIQELFVPMVKKVEDPPPTPPAPSPKPPAPPPAARP